jgi:hypothetical protein
LGLPLRRAVSLFDGPAGEKTPSALHPTSRVGLPLSRDSNYIWISLTGKDIDYRRASDDPRTAPIRILRLADGEFASVSERLAATPPCRLADETSVPPPRVIAIGARDGEGMSRSTAFGVWVGDRSYSRLSPVPSRGASGANNPLRPRCGHRVPPRRLRRQDPNPSPAAHARAGVRPGRTAGQMSSQSKTETLSRDDKEFAIGSLGAHSARASYATLEKDVSDFSVWVPRDFFRYTCRMVKLIGVERNEPVDVA